MPNDDQARADAEDATMVEDPLDASNAADEATNAYNEYDAEIDGLLGDEPEAETTDEQGDTPAEEVEQVEIAEEVVEEEEISEQEEEEEPEPEANAKPGRFRIRTDDPVEAEALELRKRHPDWSLETCLAKAKNVLGVEEGATPAKAEEAPEETVQSINDQIKALTAQKREKFADMEFEAAGDLDEQIEELREKRESLRIAEVQKSAQQQQEESSRYEQELAKSERLAVTYYPDTTDANSAMVKEMSAIDARMKALGDPLYDSPDKPFILAKQAAQKLGIPMTDPKQKPANGKSVRPVQPAPGNRRTSAPAPSARLDADLDNIQSLEDYEAFVGG